MMWKFMWPPALRIYPLIPMSSPQIHLCTGPPTHPRACTPIPPRPPPHTAHPNTRAHRLGRRSPPRHVPLLAGGRVGGGGGVLPAAVRPEALRERRQPAAARAEPDHPQRPQSEVPQQATGLRRHKGLPPLCLSSSWPSCLPDALLTQTV